MFLMNLGCVHEIIGYIGRIKLHYNPWSFVPFIIQISKPFSMYSLGRFCIDYVDSHNYTSTSLLLCCHLHHAR